MERLFHRDFLMVVLGQIISLFGNAVLRFALPFYVLDQTGSAAAFGTISAVALIPTILLSPFGGMIADRVNRRNIMVVLDFITAGTAAVFGVMLGMDGSALLKIGITLILLSVIQSFYQPAVNSSIPVLSSGENLMKANAVVNQVTSLANILGPVIGGVLYGFWGLKPIIVVSTICFFCSAVMEIFIHIPFVKKAAAGNMMETVKSDFRESFHFIIREKPILFQSMGIVCLFNLFLTSMLLVGMPFLIKVQLRLPDELYGFAQGAMGIGAIIGGFLVGAVAKRVSISRLFLVLLAVSLAVVPIGIAAIAPWNPMIAYGMILFGCAVTMALASIFTIYMLSFIQRETPEHLLGKVVALVMTTCMCAQPLGQAIFGILFDLFSAQAWIVVFGAVGAGVMISLGAKRVFSRL